MGRTVILVDEGVESGETMLTAIAAVRELGPARIVAAAPVASREAEQLIGQQADTIVFVNMPKRMYDIGLWYEDLPPVSDADVIKLLRLDTAGGAAPADAIAHA